jgi:hypothetical protein
VNRVSDENIEGVREAFHRIPRKSVATGSRELGVPKMTVWKVSRKRLCFKHFVFTFDTAPFFCVRPVYSSVNALMPVL